MTTRRETQGVILMQESQILSAVQDTARIPDQEQARQAAVATLQVLGQRLVGGETHDLASQLSGSLAEALPAEGAGERFTVDDFYKRVADAEPGDCSPEEGRRHARAVMSALRNSLTGHEFDHIAAQLPSDYDDLLGTGPALH
jgi:uncharacterized protein (DUF2267 family)